MNHGGWRAPPTLREGRAAGAWSWQKVLSHVSWLITPHHPDTHADPVPWNSGRNSASRGYGCLLLG